MKIRKLWRYHHAYFDSSDQQRVYDDHPSMSVIRPSFDSHEQYDRYTFSSSVGNDPRRASATALHCVSENDPPPVMKSTINVSICSFQHLNPETLQEEDRSSEEKTSSNAINQRTNMDSYRRHSTNTAEISAASSASSSSSSRHGCWCEEEKVFPMKKRRMSLERFTSPQESTRVLEKAKQQNKIERIRNNNTGLPRTKRGSTWASSSGNYQTNSSEIEINSYRDPAAIVEENLLRCSKVNGARWRCSKRRLEGYSLCEHHLNLGRMHKRRYVLKYGRDCRRSSTTDHSTGKVLDSVKKFWGLKEDRKNGGGGDNFRVQKKRKKMMISSILERTVPLLATADTS